MTTRHIRAAVHRKAGAPPAIEELVLSAPGPAEVVVDVAAAGICHTDVAMASGELWPRFPMVLGHEIAGTVREVGAAVSGIEPGERVLVMDGHCGRCRECEAGHPVLCRAFDRSERETYLRDTDGEAVLSSVGGFADAVLTPAHSVVPIPDDVPFEVAAIAGCSVVTGLGAVFNVAQVRPGQRVAVLGCGGVGANAVMAAVVAGAAVVVAVDPDPVRRELALSLGATHAAVPDERALLDLSPQGYDAVIECVGRVDAMELGPRVLAPGGAMVLLGATPEGTTFRIDALDMLLNQKRLLGCLRGDARPHVDFPLIWDLYRSGALQLDGLVTRTVPLDAVEDGFAHAGGGAGIRTLVRP
jgi:Zn-dependent alcohol dehydrogenase